MICFLSSSRNSSRFMAKSIVAFTNPSLSPTSYFYRAELRHICHYSERDGSMRPSIAPRLLLADHRKVTRRFMAAWLFHKRPNLVKISLNFVPTDHTIAFDIGCGNLFQSDDRSMVRVVYIYRIRLCEQSEPQSYPVVGQARE